MMVSHTCVLVAHVKIATEDKKHCDKTTSSRGNDGVYWYKLY